MKTIAAALALFLAYFAGLQHARYLDPCQNLTSQSSYVEFHQCGYHLPRELVLEELHL